MKNFTLFILVILLTQVSFSQTMTVHKNDQTTVDIPLSQIDSITFSIMPDAGLIAYYPFNGNANDESESGNDGTVNGATLTSDRFGNSDKAYSFDGTSSYIVISDTSRLQLDTTDFTIASWIKSTSSGRILSRGECNGSLGWQMTLDSEGMVTFAMQSPAFSGAYYFRSTDSSYNNGQWHFIVFTRSAGTVQLYTDGNSNGSSGTFTNTLTNTNLPLAIGRNMETSPCESYYSGTIDDIRFYNRALSPIEIQQLYHEGGW